MKKLFKVMMLTVAICGLTACGYVTVTNESKGTDEVKVEDVEDSEEETEASSTEDATTKEETTEAANQQEDETNAEADDGDDGGFTNKETKSNSDGSYFGTWKVTKYYIPGISALTNKEAEGYIGKICEYSEDVFTGDGAVTDAPDYQEFEQTADDFSANYGGITLDSIGITADSVKQVNVSNAYDFGSSFYVKDANTILISSDGVFFEAVRQ